MKRLPYVRRQAILDHLRDVDFVDINSLQKQFDVSYMTIHRDLDILEMQGDVSRIYGGVKLQNNTKSIHDLTIEKRFKNNMESKIAIAREAASYVEPGDIIGLDASTTALQMCPFLLNMDITVITNNIHVALQFSNSQTVTTLLYGGILRKSALSLIGPMIYEFEKNFNISKSFISAKSLCLKWGLSDITLEESEVKKSLIRRSGETFILVDHTKVDTSSMYTVCDIKTIDCVIMDDRTFFTPEQIDVLEDIKKQGVNLVFAKK
ncbi:MAG: DeoR/GlpR family DNA-binding transcription regulator [Spirochaetales bacterium]|jgi:DeoR/GlpR family transcriptional regulator of sugar metabolism|nr:DeoR/GlpR family DNA-binding transcription regulator [Spirochaetales bacterium]